MKNKAAKAKANSANLNVNAVDKGGGRGKGGKKGGEGRSPNMGNTGGTGAGKDKSKVFQLPSARGRVHVPFGMAHRESAQEACLANSSIQDLTCSPLKVK